MTEIDCEMFDKAVNHHRSADLGPARGDRPEVGLHRASLFNSLVRVTHKILMLITCIACFAIYLASQQCINFCFTQAEIINFSYSIK